MAKIGVESEDLRRESASVKQGSNEVIDILNRLTGEIQNLAAQWEGAASQAFQDTWHEWQTGAHQVQQAMEHMGVYLEQAAQTYETTEDHLRAATGH